MRKTNLRSQRGRVERQPNCRATLATSRRPATCHSSHPLAVPPTFPPIVIDGCSDEDETYFELGTQRATGFVKFVAQGVED